LDDEHGRISPLTTGEQIGCQVERLEETPDIFRHPAMIWHLDSGRDLGGETKSIDNDQAIEQ
jgi:hypothetical protein